MYVTNFSLYDWDISSLGFNIDGYTFSYIKLHLSTNINYNTTLPHSITPALPTLFTLPDPIMQTLDLNAHLNLIPLINIHSLEFKFIIGLFVLGIFGLIVSLVHLIFEILKNLISKGYGDGTKNHPNRQPSSGHSEQWKEYLSNNRLGDKYDLFKFRGTICYDSQGKISSGGDGDNGGNGGKKDPNDNNKLEIIKKALNLLREIRRGYITHAYITNHAYNSEGEEIRPDLMEDLRSSGTFERYGIYDRFGYPDADIREWPYPLTTTNEWYELYERITDFVWRTDPNFILHDALPGTPESLIQAARAIGLPPIHSPNTQE
jgi:hypothetical protein